MLEKGAVLTALIDSISSYFLDNCPDEMYWEDFDADLDFLRSFLQDLYDSQALQGSV